MLAITASFVIALSGCTSNATSGNPIKASWVGHSAGKFFAEFGPPHSDTSTGSTTVYTWRGGYKHIKQKDGNSARVSCSAQLIVDTTYAIRDIRITADRQGATGSSYCEELLAKAKSS